MQVTTLIMAGGKGERVWPIGRQSKPKQFLKIKGKHTLIEDAIIRAKTFCDEKNIFIITGEKYRDSFSKFLPNFPKENIIFEPTGRDTAAAVTLGVYTIEQKIPNSIVVTLPADPVIEGEAMFTTVIQKAIEHADRDNLPVTIGIKPSRAEIGYGYVHLADCISGKENIKVFRVDSFLEKPDQDKSDIISEDTSYLWNSGMFIWKSTVILSHMEKLQNDTYNKVVATYNYIKSDQFDNAKKEFSSIEKKSIDFAIMEKLTNSLCVRGDFKWDDVGSFSALSRVYTPDHQGNVKIGDNFLLDTENTIVMNNDSDSFVAVCGMKDIIVVNHKGATLIYPRGKDHIIKDLLAELEARGKTKYL